MPRRVQASGAPEQPGKGYAMHGHTPADTTPTAVAYCVRHGETFRPDGTTGFCRCKLATLTRVGVRRSR